MGTFCSPFFEKIGGLQKTLFNTAQLCWADENRFAEGDKNDIDEV
jgi:hypothetical protein